MDIEATELSSHDRVNIIKGEEKRMENSSKVP
jgi:hypothetical protein